jgi:hypothetical protein
MIAMVAQPPSKTWPRRRSVTPSVYTTQGIPNPELHGGLGTANLGKGAQEHSRRPRYLHEAVDPEHQRQGMAARRDDQPSAIARRLGPAPAHLMVQ